MNGLFPKCACPPHVALCLPVRRGHMHACTGVQGGHNAGGDDNHELAVPGTQAGLSSTGELGSPRMQLCPMWPLGPVVSPRAVRAPLTHDAVCPRKQVRHKKRVDREAQHVQPIHAHGARLRYEQQKGRQGRPHQHHLGGPADEPPVTQRNGEGADGARPKPRQRPAVVGLFCWEIVVRQKAVRE